MALVLIFIGTALIALVAWRRCADSTDTVDSPARQPGLLWPGVSGATFAARLGSVLAPLAVPTEAGVFSGMTLSGPAHLLLLEAAVLPAAAAMVIQAGPESTTAEAAAPAPAPPMLTWVMRENAKFEMVWQWPATQVGRDAEQHDRLEPTLVSNPYSMPARQELAKLPRPRPTPAPGPALMAESNA